MDYEGPDFNPSNQLDDDLSYKPISERLSLPPFSNILPNTTLQIDNILDDEIITIKDGGTRRYLVWWKGKSPTDDM